MRHGQAWRHAAKRPSAAHAATQPPLHKLVHACPSPLPPCACVFCDTRPSDSRCKLRHASGSRSSTARLPAAQPTVSRYVSMRLDGAVKHSGALAGVCRSMRFPAWAVTMRGLPFLRRWHLSGPLSSPTAHLTSHTCARDVLLAGVNVTARPASLTGDRPLSALRRPSTCVRTSLPTGGPATAS